jgi:hypothetical protein
VRYPVHLGLAVVVTCITSSVSLNEVIIALLM